MTRLQLGMTKKMLVKSSSVHVCKYLKADDEASGNAYLFQTGVRLPKGAIKVAVVAFNDACDFRPFPLPSFPCFTRQAKQRNQYREAHFRRPSQGASGMQTSVVWV